MKFVLMVIIHMTSNSVEVQSAGPFADLGACEAAGKETVKHIPTIFNSHMCEYGCTLPETVDTFCAAHSTKRSRKP